MRRPPKLGTEPAVLIYLTHAARRRRGRRDDHETMLLTWLERRWERVAGRGRCYLAGAYKLSMMSGWTTPRSGAGGCFGSLDVETAWVE